MEISKLNGQAAAPVQSKPASETKPEANAPASGPAPEAAPAPKAKSAGDTVQISSAAKKLQQEATETAAQTAKEAAGGDPQARKLIAKEDEAKEVRENNTKD